MKFQIPDWCGLLFIYGIAFLMTYLRITGTGTNPTTEGVALIWMLAASWSAAAYARHQLEKNHIEKFKELGSPVLIASIYNRSYWRFIKFIITFEFLELNNIRITLGFLSHLGLSLLVIFMMISP